MFIYLDDPEICRSAENLVTEQIQKQLDAIQSAGGGELRIPAGRYLCASLSLPSNLVLSLEAGAEIVASENIEDYYHITTQSMAELSYRALLYAKGKSNIKICGKGLIEGQDSKWFSQHADDAGYRMPKVERPRMLVLEGCDNVTLNDFTIQRSPMWTIHLVCCSNVAIDNVKVNNHLYLPNTDSIDIDSCQYVRIANCFLSAADDGVCIKTTRKKVQGCQDTKHVTVTNCVIRSRGAAIKVGTETFGNVESVLVSNISIFDSNRAIALVSRDGGNLRQMMFSNIIFESRLCVPHHWGKAEPIGISVRYRDPAIRPGNIENITFSNISGECHGAISLYSEIEHAVSGIEFNGITLTQIHTDHDDFGYYDIRPPCNPDTPTGMGLDNSYKINPETKKPFGVEIYKNGIPAIYSFGVAEFEVNNLKVIRENPDSNVWNKDNYIYIVK